MKKISNVLNYKISPEGFYFQKTDGIYHDNIKIIDLNSDFFGEFYLNSDNIIIQYYLGSFRIYKNNVLKNEFVGFYNYLSNQSIMYLNTNDNFIHFIIDYEDIKTNFKQNGYHIDSRYFVVENSIFSAFTFPEAEPLWQFMLSSLSKKDEKEYEVEKFIGVWKGQLLVTCKNQTVLSIDVNTGKLIKQWLAFPPIEMDEYKLDAIPYSLVMQLDEKKGKAIGFNFFAYWEINLTTLTIKSESLADTLKDNDLFGIKNLSGFTQDKTHYYVTAESSFKTNLERRLDNLIAINKKTLKIDWVHQFGENEALGVNIPQYSNNKLYQLDWDNNLHIFEKEETIS